MHNKKHTQNKYTRIFKIVKLFYFLIPTSYQTFKKSFRKFTNLNKTLDDLCQKAKNES